VSISSVKEFPPTRPAAPVDRSHEGEVWAQDCDGRHKDRARAGLEAIAARVPS